MSAPLADPAAALPSWQAVLDFWFHEDLAARWFLVDARFDAAIRERFAPLAEAAAAGALAAWEATPDSALALLIVLDQFPRNIWRGSARGFAGDALARDVCRRALARGFDPQVRIGRRAFFYLPLEHSEDPADQQRSCALFAQLAAAAGDADWAREQQRYAERHREIIERFVRFPHRNAALGRISTPEETAFLDEPLSSF
jgi:uncharacterized protein (DUF924 family)